MLLLSINGISPFDKNRTTIYIFNFDKQTVKIVVASPLKRIRSTSTFGTEKNCSARV